MCRKLTGKSPSTSETDTSWDVASAPYDWLLLIRHKLGTCSSQTIVTWKLAAVDTALRCLRSSSCVQFPLSGNKIMGHVSRQMERKRPNSSATAPHSSGTSPRVDAQVSATRMGIGGWFLAMIVGQERVSRSEEVAMVQSRRLIFHGYLSPRF